MLFFKHLHYFYLVVTFYICTFAVNKNNITVNYLNNPAQPIGSHLRDLVFYNLCVVFVQAYGWVFKISVKNGQKQHRTTGASATTGI